MIQPNSQFNRDPDVGKPLVAANLAQKAAPYHAILSQLGLTQEKTFGYLKYSGEINGRHVTVTAGARAHTQYVWGGDVSYRKYKGMTMSIQVKTAVKTRLLFSNATSRQSWLIKFLQQRQGNQQVITLDTFYDALNIWANEPEWAGRFVGKTAVQHALAPLLFENGKPAGALIFSPIGSVSYTPAKSLTEPTKEMLLQWIEALIALSTLAENNPPQQEASLSWLEQQTEQGRLFLLILGVLLGSTFLLGLLCIVPFFILLLLSAAR